MNGIGIGIGIGHINYSWSGEGFPFQYIVYDILGEKVIGTVVFHRNSEEISSSRAFNPPAFSVEKNNFTGLVYHGLYMDVNDYLRHLKGEWDGKAEEARDREDAANRLLEVFRNIVKLLRDQFVMGSNPFYRLVESVGIEENGTVRLLKGPGVDPISDSFEANVLELGSIAKKFRAFLSTTIENESAASELRVYEEFLASYEDWMQLHPISHHDLNFLALHHPSTIDSTSNITLVMNLGFLSNDPCSSKLSLCAPFQKSIQKNLPEWVQSAEKDPLLLDILTNGDGYNEDGYQTEDVAMFCMNALYNYRNSTHNQYHFKYQVLNHLQAQFGNVRHYVFIAYVEAILEGYEHPRFSYKKVCTSFL